MPKFDPAHGQFETTGNRLEELTRRAAVGMWNGKSRTGLNKAREEFEGNTG